MKNKIVLLVLLASVRIAFSQGFINLNFESATITTVVNPGGDTYTATVPGWTANTQNYVNGDPNSIPYNDSALDAAAVNLVGTDDPYGPSAIQGMYSIFLQGGDIYAPDTNGASIWQTAQIPANAQSIIYWGGPLNVSFDGQALSFTAISSTLNYTVYEADIAPYVGETGELLFTEPWQNSGLLDNIQFSSSPIPEPGTLALCVLGGFSIAWRRWKRTSK